MEVDQLLTTLKLLIIGESSVGKSSLLLRFTDDAFDPEQAATIGVDFKVKTIHINGDKVSFPSMKCAFPLKLLWILFQAWPEGKEMSHGLKCEFLRFWVNSHVIQLLISLTIVSG